MATLPHDAMPADGGMQAQGLLDRQAPLWPAMLVLYAILLPREIRLALGPLELSPDRLALLAVLPWLLRELARGVVQPVLCDRVVLAAGVWMIAAMVHHYGPWPGLERGGAAAFDLVTGYALARVCLRSAADLRTALLLFLPGVLLVGLVILIEAASHRLLVHPAAEALFGTPPVFEAGQLEAYRSAQKTFRLGLLRAPGPFAHSIHAGLFLASFAALYGLASFRGLARIVANLIAPLAIFTVSAAAVLGLILGYGLLLCETLQRHVREISWRLMIALAVAGAVVVELASNSGVIGLAARYLTFDPQTAFYRQLTWHHGLASVHEHMVFGIGYADYVRPGWMVSPSVDAHWLVLAMRFGVVPALLLLAATALALLRLAQASTRAPAADAALCRGLAMALFIIGLLMFTVHLWGGLNTWFTLLLGAGVTLGQSWRTAA